MNENAATSMALVLSTFSLQVNPEQATQWSPWNK